MFDLGKLIQNELGLGCRHSRNLNVIMVKITRISGLDSPGARRAWGEFKRISNISPIHSGFTTSRREIAHFTGHSLELSKTLLQSLLCVNWRLKCTKLTGGKPTRPKFITNKSPLVMMAKNPKRTEET